MAKNIEMNYYNGSTYEPLYPFSIINQIEGLQDILNDKLNLSGGTMTGNLILNGNPSSNLMAVPKQYVDNKSVIIATIYVSNGTKTGNFSFSPTFCIVQDTGRYNATVNAFVCTQNYNVSTHYGVVVGLSGRTVTYNNDGDWFAIGVK